jgi:hypothetical protein
MHEIRESKPKSRFGISLRIDRWVFTVGWLLMTFVPSSIFFTMLQAKFYSNLNWAIFIASGRGWVGVTSSLTAAIEAVAQLADRVAHLEREATSFRNSNSQ